MVRTTQFLTDLDALLPLEQRAAELLIAQTDLCPALIVRARSRKVRLFAGLEAWGLEGPMHVALPTAERIEIISQKSNTEEEHRRITGCQPVPLQRCKCAFRIVIWSDADGEGPVAFVLTDLEE